MITYINFANGQPYERIRRYNSWTAKWFGKVDNIIEYSINDIPSSYINTHIDIFSQKRGVGLWLWKPYFINKTLKTMNNGDWLFYVDSGSLVINDVHKLVKCAEENKTDIMLFEMPLLDRQFTKKECYTKLGICDYNQNQLAATYVLVRKTEDSCNFINEWLSSCEDISLLSGEHYYNDIEEFDDFYSHREDQSILTLLRIKYKLPVFRDCSDFGEFPHMFFSTHYKYSPLEYPNSNYPTIIMCSRKKNPFVYTIRYYLKCLLMSIGLVNPEKIIAKKKKIGL